MLVKEIQKPHDSDMAYVFFNPNPYGKNTGDCTIRAICATLGYSWDQAYIALAAQGYEAKEMPDDNDVWQKFLVEHGFRVGVIPEVCRPCRTVRDFCRAFPDGKYVLHINGPVGHVIGVVDGDYYDTIDSGNSTPLFFWKKED